MEYNITYRKKDKGWQYIITAKENGKWKYKASKQGFSTKALAKVAAEEHLDKLKEKEEVQLETLPEHKGITFQQLAEIYKKHKKIHHAVNTGRAFDNAILHFVSLNDMAVDSISSLNIQGGVGFVNHKAIPNYYKDVF